jgi:plasmid maintenance system antidote protein VapI
VQKQFSVRESARLLGVAPSTVSRHLPRGRVRHGRRADLTTDEVLDLAPEIGADREAIQRKVDLAENLGEDLPAQASYWLDLALELDLASSIERHQARVPVGYWTRERPAMPEFELPHVPTDAIDWQPLTQESLDEIIPPVPE